MNCGKGFSVRSGPNSFYFSWCVGGNQENRRWADWLKQEPADSVQPWLIINGLLLCVRWHRESTLRPTGCVTAALNKRVINLLSTAPNPHNSRTWTTDSTDTLSVSTASWTEQAVTRCCDICPSCASYLSNRFKHWRFLTHLWAECGEAVLQPSDRSWSSAHEFFCRSCFWSNWTEIWSTNIENTNNYPDSVSSSWTDSSGQPFSKKQTVASLTGWGPTRSMFSPLKELR